jgi:hypothetical protein
MTAFDRAFFIGCLLGMMTQPAPGLADSAHAVVVVASASGAHEVQAPATSKDRAAGTDQSEAAPPSPKASQPVVWAPRTRRGAPAARMGGASRRAGSQLVVLALVPEIDEAALTLREQPSVHWHLSDDSPHAVNFTLLDPNAIDPILDVTLDGPFTAGFHAVELAAHGGRLEVGTRYEWYVAVVPDPARRSADSVARGTILRVSEPDLESQLSRAESDRALSLLASSGIWYEAMESVQRRVQERPDDPEPRAERDALLAQVGIELED